MLIRETFLRQNPTRKKRPPSYKEKVRLLRRLGADAYQATRGYDLRDIGDWTPQKKAAVTRSFERVRHYVESDTRVQKVPRSKRALETLKRDYMPEAPKWLNRVFIPTDEPGEELHYDIIRKKDPETGKTRYVSRITTPRAIRETIYLDRDLLSTDPEAAVEKAIGHYPEDTIFVIRAAEYYSQYGGLKESTEHELLDMTRRYGSDNYDKNDPSSHHFLNWLFKVEKFGEGDMAEAALFLAEIKELNEDLKKKRRKRKQELRKKGNPKQRRDAKKKPSNLSEFLH